MNPNNLRHTASAFIILMAIVACMLPGQAAQPMPVANPINIETAVAGTAQAAAQLTQQANPVTATSTVEPTDTPTSTPKVSTSGTSLIISEDQSALFIDHKAGIQLVIPAGWMAVRVGEDEYLKAFSSDVVLQNPDILDRLTTMRDIDTNKFRLDAIDLQAGHMLDGVLTVISVVFEQGDVRSLQEWEKAEKNRYNPYAGYKFISAKYPQTNNGTQVLVIEKRYSANNGKSTLYYRGVFFVLPSGTYVLDFYTNFAYKDDRLLEFDEVVNSLTPLHP